MKRNKGYYADESGNIFSKNKKIKLINRKNRLYFSIRYNGIRTPLSVSTFVAHLKYGFSYSKLCKKYNTSKSTLSYLFNNAYYSGVKTND